MITQREFCLAENKKKGKHEQIIIHSIYAIVAHKIPISSLCIVRSQ